jgi:hypothetical protein
VLECGINADMRRILVLVAIFSIPVCAIGKVKSHKHTITLKFDYDFQATPACTSNLRKDCVERFNIYDISQGFTKRIKLTSIPVPPGARGFVKGISVTTPSLTFEVGQHALAVTAETPAGLESDPNRCRISVKVR